MLKPNRVKQALKRGEPVVGTMISESNSTGFIWMLANVGFDYVFIDMEHGAFDLPAVADMIKVARLANLTPLVRVPDLAYHLVAQALDAGAMGLMLPRVETREQVEQFVSYIKYPPLGVRGASAGRGHTEYGGPGPQELVRHMNEHTLAVLQIERQRAVDNIDELLSVPGVDVALIGPFDLTISLGEERVDSPAVDAAIQKVVDAAKRHGLASGTHTGDPAVVLDWYRRGMTMLTCNSDLGFFKAGAQQTHDALRMGTGIAKAADGQAASNLQV
jgi:2-dehydro-3-deoxyglucarate aldolase/4-hydroxy-2-oxoheptanedioate aldolase